VNSIVAGFWSPLVVNTHNLPYGFQILNALRIQNSSRRCAVAPPVLKREIEIDCNGYD
jgi:hypothetical protein